MSQRKQQLLKRYRRNKRVLVLLIFCVLAVLGSLLAWWLIPLMLLLAWIGHEAWFADHLFYSPRDDYHYAFPAGTADIPVVIQDGRLLPGTGFVPVQTLILEVRLHSRWLGHWLDPFVRIGEDRQYFERGVRGRRYLNLSGLGHLLNDGELRISAHLCCLQGSVRLHAFDNPDYAQRRLMVLAPHADDAELAAFGLYSRCDDVSIVTLSQGEIEAYALSRLGLETAPAARLKGRLRTWNSLTIPLWGGVPQNRCTQLGYYCLQFQQMAANPDLAFASRESEESDIRIARRHNPMALPGDVDGRASWTNLVSDLVALLEHYRPEVVVMPHPELDPHPDHVATTRALGEAVALSTWKPQTALLYANHLHDNDRWPMGPAGQGTALPPTLRALPADALWSPSLSVEEQLDKAMALAMQYDLQGRLRFKARLRRLIQWILVRRRWPATGDDEFFRKAVRRHELFWVRPLSANAAELQAVRPG